MSLQVTKNRNLNGIFVTWNIKYWIKNTQIIRDTECELTLCAISENLHCKPSKLMHVCLWLDMKNFFLCIIVKYSNTFSEVTFCSREQIKTLPDTFSWSPDYNRTVALIALSINVGFLHLLKHNFPGTAHQILKTIAKHLQRTWEIIIKMGW